MSVKLFKGHRWVGEELTADIHVGEIRNGNDFPTEVVTIHYTLFFKPMKRQRAVLRMLLWWTIKYYFKILFK
jgi:hypothetical protein